MHEAVLDARASKKEKFLLGNGCDASTDGWMRAHPKGIF
jgi:hypothetical protein